MSAITDSESIRKQLVANLRDRGYRQALVEQHIGVGIPAQIRALREREGWTQKELGDRTGQKQSRISLIERMGYDSYNVKTLLRMAGAFDVALIVRFAPYSELVNHMSQLSREHVLVAKYEEDPGLYPLQNENIVSFMNTATGKPPFGTAESQAWSKTSSHTLGPGATKPTSTKPSSLGLFAGEIGETAYSQRS